MSASIPDTIQAQMDRGEVEAARAAARAALPALADRRLYAAKFGGRDRVVSLG